MTPQQELEKICQELSYDINKLTRYEWQKISCYKYLSEEFIVEYKYSLSSFHISQYQVFSEFFIEEHIDWLWLVFIRWNQFMSDVFINRMEFQVCEENNKLFDV